MFLLLLDFRLVGRLKTLAIWLKRRIPAGIVFADRTTVMAGRIGQSWANFRSPRACAMGLPAFASEAGTATAGTIRLGARFVHVQSTAIEVHAVDGGDGFIALSVVCHLHEAEASCLTGVAIRNDVDTIDRAVGFEQRTDRFFRSPKTEVSNVNVLQLYFPLLI
jgi:hypothetical protein